LGNLEGAVGDREAAVEAGEISEDEGSALLVLLSGVGARFAEDAILVAEKNGGKPSEIWEAKEYLAEGNHLREDGQYKDAVAKYKDAVAKAEGSW